MFNRYKNSLTILLKELHEARKEPLKDIKKWLHLQLKILKKVQFIEGRMSDIKQIIAQLKRDLKTPGKYSSKSESKKTKILIQGSEQKIEEYKFLILCFKSVADGIAFTFIDKFDIKPQNFKESAGFVSGKRGLITELKLLKYSYKKQWITILNDLTTVLKYNDVTVITPKKILTIEAKTSTIDSPRILRQKSKTKALFNYLESGHSGELYGLRGQFVRRDMELTEIDYAQSVNVLIREAKKQGYSFKLVEKGLLYLVSRVSDPKDLVWDNLIGDRGLIKKPVYYSLNSNKFPGQAYYPFSLSLSPEYYIDFLAGEFVIIVLMDFEQIEKISASSGYSVRYVQNEPWVFEFQSRSDGTIIKASDHLMGRVYYEFISVEHLIKDGFLQIERIRQGDKPNKVG